MNNTNLYRTMNENYEFKDGDLENNKDSAVNQTFIEGASPVRQQEYHPIYQADPTGYFPYFRRPFEVEERGEESALKQPQVVQAEAVKLQITQSPPENFEDADGNKGGYFTNLLEENGGKSIPNALW